MVKVHNAPDIWSIPVELPDNPLRNLNAYVIRTEAGNLVIDTGFNRPECRNALWAGLNELGLDMDRTALFLTHLHSDHVGLVQDFVDRGCTVYMNSIDYDYFCRSKTGQGWSVMEDVYRKEGFPEDVLLRQKTENQARKYAPEIVFPAVPVVDGSKIYLGKLEIQCIHTPGHTPGHTVLYLPETQILFSGDHILFDITPNISIWNGVPQSLADYLQSLQKIRRLPIRMTLPAHRARQEDVYERIRQLTVHHQERLQEVLQAVQKKPASSAYWIASQISWSMRGKPWTEFPPHQKWFAMGETLAHLYYLVAAGQIRRIETNGRFYYEAI